METSDERLHDQVPAVHENEQKDFERQGYDDRWQHHHTHGQQNTGDDQVDHQEGYEEDEPYLKSDPQLTDYETRNQDSIRNLGPALRLIDSGQTYE